MLPLAVASETRRLALLLLIEVWTTVAIAYRAARQDDYCRRWTRAHHAMQTVARTWHWLHAICQISRQKLSRSPLQNIYQIAISFLRWFSLQLHPLPVVTILNNKSQLAQTNPRDALRHDHRIVKKGRQITFTNPVLTVHGADRLGQWPRPTQNLC